MFKNAFFYTLCVLSISLSSCVSKSKYTELETSLRNTQAQLNHRNLDLWDLQERHDELDRETAQLSGTVVSMKQNLDQARSDIREKEDAIGKLTNNLGQAESIISRQESTMGSLRANLGEAQSAIQEKDTDIGSLRHDLGRTQEVLREKEHTILELDRTRREIEYNLKEQIAQKDVKIEEIEGKLKVTFVDKILFDSGSTEVKKKGQEALLTLAESLAADSDNTIVVEGHTDDVKIAYPLAERFPSNWELSTARAASVVRFLQEEANIEPERLTATGYGFYHPIASNDSEEARSQNRRIEIILIPIR